MMGTIRTSARLFKAAVDQVLEAKQKITDTVNKLRTRGKQLASRVTKVIKSFFASFVKRKRPRKAELILLERKASVVNKSKGKKKQQKKSHKPKGSKPRKVIKLTGTACEDKMNDIKSESDKGCRPDKKQADSISQEIKIHAGTIKGFYQEWEANWGPALTSLDKEFLESASPETVAKVIKNGRLTLKSPYLKAVYNGLKDLCDISDLLENDELAKEKVGPVIKYFWDQSPEKFLDRLMSVHDKGYFPTRSGERRLSLDPRLVPEWLGLVG